MGGEGRAAPRLRWQWVKKDGCAQRTGAHARPKPTSFNYILLILRIKLLRNSLRNHPEIPNNTKNQNPEQKEIRIHNERSQQQKSNDNSENFLVNCVFIFAHDNNCLYWIENKLFLLFIYYRQDPSAHQRLKDRIRILLLTCDSKTGF